MTPQEGIFISTHKLGKWHEAFLLALGNGASVAEACRLVRVSRETVYCYRRVSDEFAAAWDRATEKGLHAVEESLARKLKETHL